MQSEAVRPAPIKSVRNNKKGGKYNRENETRIFPKRNEQNFYFFASFFLLFLRPLKSCLGGCVVMNCTPKVVHKTFGVQFNFDTASASNWRRS